MAGDVVERSDRNDDVSTPDNLRGLYWIEVEIVIEVVGNGDLDDDIVDSPSVSGWMSTEMDPVRGWTPMRGFREAPTLMRSRRSLVVQ
jgi:hypothetical protein